MLPVKDLKFRTDAERKQFERGMAEVQRKLSGHVTQTPQELEAATIARGRAEILKKFGSAFYRKTFGTEPAKTMAPAAKPAPATPARVKTFADTGERSPRKLHIYTCRQWLPAHP